MPLRVDNFVFPTYFMIMNVSDDEETLILLVRPFVAMRRTIVDVETRELTMSQWTTSGIQCHECIKVPRRRDC